jgi:hypothetical protein
VAVGERVWSIVAPCPNSPEASGLGTLPRFQVSDQFEALRRLSSIIMVRAVEPGWSILATLPCAFDALGGACWFGLVGLVGGLALGSLVVSTTKHIFLQK